MFQIDHMKVAMNELLAQREALIMGQILELVQKGLLVMELGEMVIIQSPQKASYELRQSVRIALKDKEYIEKLEKENAELIKQIAAIREIVSGMVNPRRKE